jgi:hypothetical protein
MYRGLIFGYFNAGVQRWWQNLCFVFNCLLHEITANKMAKALISFLEKPNMLLDQIPVGFRGT